MNNQNNSGKLGPRLLGDPPKVTVPTVENGVGEGEEDDEKREGEDTGSLLAIKIYDDEINMRFLVCGLPCTLVVLEKSSEQERRRIAAWSITAVCVGVKVERSADQDYWINTVFVKDVVRILMGPCEGKQGPVEHILTRLLPPVFVSSSHQSGKSPQRISLPHLSTVHNLRT